MYGVQPKPLAGSEIWLEHSLWLRTLLGGVILNKTDGRPICSLEKCCCTQPLGRMQRVLMEEEMSSSSASVFLLLPRTVEGKRPEARQPPTTKYKAEAIDSGFMDAGARLGKVVNDRQVKSTQATKRFQLVPSSCTIPQLKDPSQSSDREASCKAKACNANTGIG